MRRPVPFLALLVAACAFEPPGATPFDPPATYRGLWDSAQSCTGRRGAYTGLRFFIVPGRSFPTPESERAVGHTDGQTIYIAEDWADHPMVVKHEMIHALGFGSSHPRVPFETPCGATWETYRGAQWLPEGPG